MEPLTAFQAGDCRASVTHEFYIQALKDAVLGLARLNEEDRERLNRTKVVYGAGARGVRGRCYFEVWHRDQAEDFVELSAMGEESLIQLAGTTVHELAHVLAGSAAGHGARWRKAALRLGLFLATASGQSYEPVHFDQALWAAIQQIPKPTDGTPARAFEERLKPVGCPAGIGTRRGSSRGPGSGSRLRLWSCRCERPVKVRVASDTFRALCLECNSEFSRR